MTAKPTSSSAAPAPTAALVERSTPSRRRRERRAVARHAAARLRPRPRAPGTLAKTAKVAKGVASIKVSCPAGTAGCKGSVALFSTKTIKVGPLKAQLELGRASFNVDAGQSKTIKVKLASGTAKLAKKKKLAVSGRASGARRPRR